MRREEQELGPDEIRRVFKIVEECREHWADRVAWQEVLLQSVREILQSRVAALQFMMPGTEKDRPVLLPVRSCGWTSKRAEELYLESCDPSSGVSMPRFDSEMQPVMGDGVAAYSRRMAVPDEVWYDCEFYQRYAKGTGTDEFALSIKAAPHLESAVMLGGNMPEGADPVPLVSVRQLALLAEEIVPRMGTELTLDGQVGVDGLAPRQREALDHLLHGLSEKEVAAQMGISKGTVHDYVVQLHRHFHVSSRGELLSYFVQRKPKAVLQ